MHGRGARDAPNQSLLWDRMQAEHGGSLQDLTNGRALCGDLMDPQQSTTEQREHGALLCKISDQRCDDMRAEQPAPSPNLCSPQRPPIRTVAVSSRASP